MARIIHQLAIAIVLLVLQTPAFTQSKTPLVSQSSLTGAPLPAGSKQDKRLLYTSAARTMMAMVSEPTGVKTKREEVLTLPAMGQTTYNADSLMESLAQLGWRIELIPDEDDFVWLEKNGTWVLVYYKEGKKQTELYFAEVDKKPEPPLSRTAPPTPATPSNTPPPPGPSNPAPTSNAGNTQQLPLPQQNNAPAGQPAPSGYTFHTTNFEDGWTAVVESDWVRVTKGPMTVLLHYNHYQVDYSSLQQDIMTRNAWNAIVAPRYSNLRNFFIAPHMTTWQAPLYGSGVLSDAAGDHFVVIYRSGGKNEWIEFIAPDRQTFMQYFGANQDNFDTWTGTEVFRQMDNMYGRNYFAVGASDLPGEWTTNSFGMTQYYNVNTGLSAGATSHSSSETFTIGTDLSYSWSIGMASGWVGAQRFDNAKSKGMISLTNAWNAHFSEIEGKPRDYPVYFTAHKGGRRLWINGNAFMKK